MPWEKDQNYRSLSPAGLKLAEGFAAHVNSSFGTEMCPGILGAPISVDPHGAGPKSNVYMPKGSRP
jgi:hypothetical protein